MEELWISNGNLEMCTLSYPISSYESCTYLTLSESEMSLRNIDTDEDVENIVIEYNTENKIYSKELKDVAIDIFNSLNEERLRLFINQFQ